MTIDGTSKRFPPEVSYETFESLMGRLQMHLPTHIDMSYLSGEFSMDTSTRLMHAISFLNLIDANNRTTPRLKLLVSATGEHRAALLRQVADEAYAFVFKGWLDTQNSTYNELEEVFLNTYRMHNDIVRKCVNFFIDYCEDAGIPLSPQITQKRQMAHTSPGIQNTTQKWMPHVIDYGKHLSDNLLQQITFLHLLRKDFDRFHHLYLKAFQVLVKYNQIPKEMTEDEWGRVVNALSEHYQSVRFLYKIAMLTESGIINADFIYILYYEEIAENLTLKLSMLLKWCGTGLDLAANYNSYSIARMGIKLINLLEKLNMVHQEHGADLAVEGDSAFIENFKERTKDFFSDPSEFDMASPNYVDRYVTIR
jgi:hypothetical protein